VGGLHHLGQAVAVVVVQLLDAGVQARKGLPCEGSTSVSSGSG
jgi:hypothetical protein